jgi:hypothetical protein
MSDDPPHTGLAGSGTRSKVLVQRIAHYKRAAESSSGASPEEQKPAPKKGR